MTRPPVVSIITPAYNHEAYIRQCVGSVMRQTFPDWEQIIIDDASTDGTPHIIEECASADRRIKFIRRPENRGIFRLGETYGQALDMARGELIAILEGDDFWPEDKLAAQVPCFDEQRVVLSWGRAAFADESGRPLGARPWSRLKDPVASNRPVGTVLKALLYRNIIPPVTAVMRRSELLSIGGFQHRPYLPCVDYPTFLALSLRGEFCFMPGIMGYWRRHAGQMTAEHGEELALGASRFAEEFLSYIPMAVQRKHNLSRSRVVKKEKARVAAFFLSESRFSLAGKKWTAARKASTAALKKGPFLLKGAGLAGILLGFFHVGLPLRGAGGAARRREAGT